jgi:hypothetical protein
MFVKQVTRKNPPHASNLSRGTGDCDIDFILRYDNFDVDQHSGAHF